MTKSAFEIREDILSLVKKVEETESMKIPLQPPSVEYTDYGTVVVKDSCGLAIEMSVRSFEGIVSNKELGNRLCNYM